MIDLHSHILPGIDDGAADLDASLVMARIAAADGITRMACTPHIVPGLYENSFETIAPALAKLTQALLDRGIPLQLVIGADVHIAPDLDVSLASGIVPTLNRTRYFLLEPPHHILPPKLEEVTARLIKASFVPIITHPERLTWLKAHYGVIESLNGMGCLIQVTADSITGGFGKEAQYLAHRLLDERRVDIIATDCHGPVHRRPVLTQARQAVTDRLGETEARAMVVERPSAILENRVIAAVGSSREAASAERRDRRVGLLKRFFGGGGI